MYGTRGFCCSATAAALLLALAASAAGPAVGGIVVPTAAQHAWQSTMLRTFHHFDICTFTGCEHNSGTEGKGSGPPSAFNVRRSSLPVPSSPHRKTDRRTPRLLSIAETG
jgi:hypothetical protein